VPAIKPDPLRELLAFQQQIAKRVEEKLGVGRSDSLEDAPAAGAPPVDLFETPDAFVLRAELPGAQPEDVTLTVEGRMLTLRGNRNGTPRKNAVPRKTGRRTGVTQDGPEYHRMEREHGSFQRVFVLPKAVEAGKIETRWVDGVLEVKLSKKGIKSPSKRSKRR